MSKSTLIRGGTVVNADCSERADVLIKDGKIVAVGEGALRATRSLMRVAATSCPAALIRTPTWTCPSWARRRPMIMKAAPWRGLPAAPR